MNPPRTLEDVLETFNRPRWNPQRRLTVGRPSLRSATKILASLAVVLSSVSLLPRAPAWASPGAAAALPAAAGPAAPQRVTFGIEPASASGPDGRPAFTYSATSGVAASDHVALLNYSTTALTLQVYPTDAVETAQGGFGLAPAAQRSTGVGTWVTLAHGPTVRVPAEAHNKPGVLVIPFTIRIPAATGPGDHSGGLVVSLRTVGRNSTGQVVTLDQRVGARIYVRVAGAVKAGLAVEALRASYDGVIDPVGSGKARVTWRIVNTGDVNESVTQKVALHGWLGSPRPLTLAPVALLLPGASIDESVTVGQVWPEIHGSAQVVYLATPSVPVGLGPVTSAHGSRSTGLWEIPWTLLGIAVVIAGGYLLHRRRRNRKPKSSPPPVEASKVEEKV